MTNAMIVLNESVRLMEEGKIGTTGRKIVVEDAAGQKIEMDEPEAIHTYQTWKALGYQVQKGQKAVAQFSIWKYKAKVSEMEMVNVETGKKETVQMDDSKMFMKLASWFSASQVQKLA